MHKKAFIFDIDGTLLDSLSLHEEAFWQACESVYHISEELKKELEGKTSIHKLDILVRKGLVDRISVPWIFERKNEIALDLCFENYKPKLQQIDAMNFIHNQLNCRIVLCSNSPRNFVNKFIDKCGFEHAISFALSGDDVELKKPAPDIYTKAFRLLNIKPDEAIIFEDSPEGEVAAIRAGCHNVIPVSHAGEISPSFIQKIINKYSIQYYHSSYMVHK